jgi:small conductance mechanosensitive channel
MVHVLVTLVIGIAFLLLFKKFISAFFRSLRNRSRLQSYHQRIETLETLIESIVSIGIFISLLLMILRDFGFDITPLLTGAGLLGLAVSFGSQTLVRDFLAGFFIILENQFNVGDTIKIGDAEGMVYKMHLRTTVLRDKKDNLIFIPNSEIKQVVVLSRKP